LPFFEQALPRVASRRVLFALDATADAARLGDGAFLARAARAAVAAGGGRVLGEVVASPGETVDVAVLIGGSHLSLHAWPQEGRVAIALLACDSLDHDAVIEHLGQELALGRRSLRRLRRLPA
jgi:S-adenosylmethionine/arginine decarboxylase-like enzyme